VSSPAAQAPTDRPHPMFARQYARLSGPMEEAGMAALRAELLTGLGGAVVEVGAGNGMNFGHYPPTVSRVDAVEPEPYLRSLATRAAAASPVPVTVHAGTAERLPLADASADAAVLCLVMCSVDDVPGALAELRRVLRPGGSVRFLEHTAAPTPGLLLVQRALDATVWPRAAGGCHLARDPVAALTAAGFTITTLRRLRYPDRRVTLPVTPHALGIARAPGAGDGNPAGG
jgi:ubiquinone/menaquinone biosynthesis C-methylase UbiE